MGIFTVVSNFCNSCLLGRQPTCHCGRVVPCVAASNVTGLYNAALNRPVFSSSVLLNHYHIDKKYNFTPSLANDGSRETHIARGGAARCFHSQLWEDYPWWAVDLGQAMSIYRVDFTNRGDCCGMTKSIPAFVIVALVDPSQLTGAFAQSGRTQNSNIESFCSNAALLLYHSITAFSRKLKCMSVNELTWLLGPTSEMDMSYFFFLGGQLWWAKCLSGNPPNFAFLLCTC